MQISDQYHRVPLGQIKIDRESRQRKEIDTETDGLRESIQRHGVWSPVLLDRDFKLIFGERRFTACMELGLPDIPARFIDELSPTEARLIELEENLRREELPWRDFALAVAELHDTYKQEAIVEGRRWSYEDTSAKISYGERQIRVCVRVARDIDSKYLAEATGLTQAFNILDRLDQRKIGDALGQIVTAGEDLFEPAPPGAAPGAANGGKDAPANAAPMAKSGPPVRASLPGAIGIAPVADAILEADFLRWATTYTGPKFNFLHLDFPYGVNVFAGKYANTTGAQTAYDDGDAVYWNCIAGLCEHINKIMLPSFHMMCWCSSDVNRLARTIELFEKLVPGLAIDRFPLFWIKSDNVGIMPDPKRSTRRVVETALFGRREDRLVVKPISNAYTSPSDKSHHPSAKPEPMLRHFFQMFVDENTQMLDPTSGSGSALRAAESLGAKRVLGIERDPEHVKVSRSALQQFRVLRALASKDSAP